MSHTSTISTVTIKDIHALRAACNELKDKHGVNLTLLENEKPRAYFASQDGMEEAAPYCIRLNSRQYDVGLYYNPETEGYEARCDLWNGEIEQDLGISSRECSRDQAALGKLYNLYGVHAAMRAAAAQGHTDIQRIDEEDGTVRLVIGLAA